MQPGTFVGMLSGLSLSPPQSAGKKLEVVHNLNTLLENEELHNGVVAYFKTSYKGTQLKDKLKAIAKLAAEYHEYKKLTALVAKLQDESPPDGLEVKETPQGLVVVNDDIPLTLSQLQYLQANHKCKDPKCTEDHSTLPLILAPSCHPGLPVMSIFKEGFVELICVGCGSSFLKVKVAEN